MKNILLTIEYDGKNFSGWARQPKVRTVQGELEKVISFICRTPITLEATGRTDAGVHAMEQCATFCGEFGIPIERLPKVLNDILSVDRLHFGDVRILNAKEVEKGFHARFNAKGKTYTYMIRYDEDMPVFLSDYRYMVKKPLDLTSVRKALSIFKGEHDFATFMASGGKPGLSTVRHIYGAELAVFDLKDECGHDETKCDIAISITGNGFLYNMVRIIVGTLVDVGHGKIDVSDVYRMIRSRDRNLAGHTAPPQGLYMKKVYFTEEDMKKGAEEIPSRLPF